MGRTATFKYSRLPKGDTSAQGCVDHVESGSTPHVLSCDEVGLDWNLLLELGDIRLGNHHRPNDNHHPYSCHPWNPQALRDRQERERLVLESLRRRNNDAYSDWWMSFIRNYCFVGQVRILAVRPSAEIALKVVGARLRPHASSSRLAG